MAQLTAYFMMGEAEGFYTRIHENYLLNLYEYEEAGREAESYFIFKPQKGVHVKDDVRIVPNHDHSFEDAMLAIHLFFFQMGEEARSIMDRIKEGDSYDFTKLTKEERPLLRNHIEPTLWENKRLVLTTFPNAFINRFLKEDLSPYPYLEVFRSSRRTMW